MRSSKNSADLRPIAEGELCSALFSDFRRRQRVTYCLRNDGGGWREAYAPSIDDWSAADYDFLIECLRHTLQTGDAVFGMFVGGKLKGFASVEGAPLGKDGVYRDLTSIHVSEEFRGRGWGRKLFDCAKGWAKAHGAEKLYISSHSAVESQAFYRAMGCTDALERIQEHVQKEPLDRQLECLL